MAKLKYACADCKPCPHGKLKSNCTVCSGCEHGKWKYKCKACKSSRAKQPVAPEVKPDPEVKLEQPEIKPEPEIKEEQEEPFTIRGYFGFA